MIRPGRTVAVAVPQLLGNEKAYVLECLETNWLSGGRFVGDFEAAFAAFCETKHALSCCNGTCALHLLLLASGIGPGDEVIVPDLTFIASANAVRYCGADVVLADVDPETMCLSAETVEPRITPRTRAILAVHLHGHPAEMDGLLELAERRGVLLLEDAAEAHGALCGSRPVGSLAHGAAFSFYGNKILTCGEGGMITTADESLYRRAKLLRGQHMDPERRYWFDGVGFNYRMTNPQAALGLAQLECADQHLAARRRVADHYRTALQPLADRLELPIEKPWARHVHWMFTVVLADSVRISRDELLARLASLGVETRPFFYPLHQMPPYLNPDAGCPVAERLGRQGLCLPTHGALTDSDIQYVVDCVRAILDDSDR